jgi:hypothetical protein
MNERNEGVVIRAQRFALCYKKITKDI